MPGPKTQNKESIFERFNFLKKIKEMFKKSIESLRTAVTGVSIRVLAGKEEYLKWLDDHNSEVDKQESTLQVGSKIAYREDKYMLEGIVLAKNEDKDGKSVTVELCNGRIVSIPAEDVVTKERFEERNKDLPDAYKQVLIDKESYDNAKKLHDEQEKEKKPQEKTPEEKAKDVDVPKRGDTYIFLETGRTGNVDMVLRATEVKIVNVDVDKQQISVISPYDNKPTVMPLKTFEDWRAMPQETFVAHHEDAKFPIKTFEHPEGEIANDYVQRKAEAVKDVKETKEPQEIDELIKSAAAQKRAEEHKFDVPESVQSEVDDIRAETESELDAELVYGVINEQFHSGKFEISDSLQQEVNDTVAKIEEEVQSGQKSYTEAVSEMDDLLKKVENEHNASVELEQSDDAFREKLADLINEPEQDGKSKFEISDDLKGEVGDIQSELEGELFDESDVKFEVPDDIKQEVDDVIKDVEAELTPEEILGFEGGGVYYGDGEPAFADDLGSEPTKNSVHIASTRDDLAVGDHFVYAYKGKYQEATVTAINKKSIEIETNDGKSYQIKNADKASAVFGYDDISKKDKAIIQCLEDEKNTKFSDEFRNAYDQMAEEDLQALLGDFDFAVDELEGLDIDDIDDEPVVYSLSEQVDAARSEADSQRMDFDNRDDKTESLEF